MYVYIYIYIERESYVYLSTYDSYIVYQHRYLPLSRSTAMCNYIDDYTHDIELDRGIDRQTYILYYLISWSLR